MSTPKPFQPIVQLVCALFNPLLMLTYFSAFCYFYTPLAMMPPKVKYIFLGTVFFYTALLPAMIIGLMYYFRVISDWRMTDRRDRVIPYLITLLCYGVNVVILRHYGFLDPVTIMLFKGSLVILGALWIINIWWKISSHTAASASLPLLMLLLHVLRPDATPLWPALFFILVVGMVGSARIYLGRHTLAQVSCGALLGLVASLCSFFL